MDKRAELSVEVLIIFIAALVVVIVVSYAIISAYRDEGETARTIADRTTSGLGEPLDPMVIDVTRQGDYVDTFFITAKIPPRGEPIIYEDLIIIMYERQNESVYLYDNSSTDCSNISDEAVFQVEPTKIGDFYQQGRINKEDAIRVCFKPREVVPENDVITILITTKYGQKKVLELPIKFESGKYLSRLYP